ncbi:MAG: hypothetical protein IJK93_09490 [Muribaculaceae bacterium]|nr:hypothetical protein [Muribaculaceae bacterium]
MNINKTPISIERHCPICSGRINTKFISDEDIELYKHVLDPVLSLWGSITKRQLIESIPGSIEDFLSMFESLGDSLNFQKCEKCGYVWNMFDETDIVLCSNNEQLIQKYTLFIENMTQFFNLVANEADLSELMIGQDSLWRLNLIKTKLYHFCDCNDHIKTVSNNYDYSNLCLESLHCAEKHHTDNSNLLSIEYELRADMSDNILQRFNLLNAALTPDITTWRKIKLQKNINELYSDVLDRWTKPIKVDNRQIIFIANNLDDIAGFYDHTNSINHIFTIDRIPSSIKFKYGRPTGNKLYIVNPVNPDEYIPYENHEELLFWDKIRELKRILRSLGASKITFTSIRGASVEEIDNRAIKAGGEVSLLTHKLSGEYSSGQSQRNSSSTGQTVGYFESLDTYEHPSLPNDLHWYDNEPDWKDLVEARLNHNQLHFEQSISTKQMSSLDEQSQIDVNAAYENLIFSINANYHREREFHVKVTEETMWRITAEFKPLSEFSNSQKAASDGIQNSYSSEEQQYLDSIKRCLEDGGINDHARIMLETVRKALEISEDRAIFLEETLTPKLTDNEKEYLDSVKSFMINGEISSLARQLLEVIRKAKGLSEDRAKEIETMV